MVASLQPGKSRLGARGGLGTQQPHTAPRPRRWSPPCAIWSRFVEWHIAVTDVIIQQEEYLKILMLMLRLVGSVD